MEDWSSGYFFGVAEVSIQEEGIFFGGWVIVYRSGLFNFTLKN